MKHTGLCLCGKVAFEVQGSFEKFYLCHCGRCRKDTGSAHAANLFSSTATLTWLSGEENVRTFTVEGTSHTKCFCKDCGSALPHYQQEGTLLVVPAGSLESDVPIRPDGHIFTGSRANWDSELESIPAFEALPNEE